MNPIRNVSNPLTLFESASPQKIDISAARALIDKIEAYRERYKHPSFQGTAQTKALATIHDQCDRVLKFLKKNPFHKSLEAKIKSFISGSLSLESPEINDPMHLVIKILDFKTQKNLALVSLTQKNRVFSNLCREAITKYDRHPEFIQDIPIKCLYPLSIGSSSFVIPAQLQTQMANACLLKGSKNNSQSKLLLEVLKTDYADTVIINGQNLSEINSIIETLKILKNVSKLTLLNIPSTYSSTFINSIPPCVSELTLVNFQILGNDCITAIQNLTHIIKLEITNLSRSQPDLVVILPPNIECLISKQADGPAQCLDLINLKHPQHLQEIHLSIFSLNRHFEGLPGSLKKIHFHFGSGLNGTRIDDDFIQNHLASLTNLETITFEKNYNCLIKGETLNQLPKDCTVKMGDLSHLSENGLRNYLKRGTQLYLDIHDINTKIYLPDIITKITPETLKHVTIPTRPDFLDILNALQLQSHLTKLEITLFTSINTDTIFENLPLSLEHLTLISKYFLTVGEKKLEIPIKHLEVNNSLTVFKLIEKGLLPASLETIKFNLAFAFVSPSKSFYAQENVRHLKNLKQLITHNNVYEKRYSQLNTPLNETKFNLLAGLIDGLPPQIEKISLPNLTQDCLVQIISQLHQTYVKHLDLRFPTIKSDKLVVLPPSLETLHMRSHSSAELNNLLSTIDCNQLPQALTSIEFEWLDGKTRIYIKDKLPHVILESLQRFGKDSSRL